MQIWTGMFDTSKSNKSNNSDGGSKQSSASSTMQSTDSGCATSMYSPSMIFSVQEKFPRPITIGKKHALKKYDQFALNTSCFWENVGSSCAILRNFCYKNDE